MKHLFHFFIFFSLSLIPLHGTEKSGTNTRPFLNQTGLDAMAQVDAPEEVAPGIWKIRIGECDKELGYLSFADRSPRWEALRQFPVKNFPFKAGDIRYTMNPDGNIGLRFPAPPQENIFGFGLQLDGIKKRNRVLDIRVDHWGNGKGQTHAPVPFYLSDRGYGIFINTARPLKAYAQVGNRKDAPFKPDPVDRNPPADEKKAEWNSQPIGDAVEIHLQGKGVEIYVFAGEHLQEIVTKYNLLCGGGALPPLWGLGFWHRVPAPFTDKETLAEIEEFKERNIPLDVIGLEPGWMSKSYPCTFEWQKKRFPDPDSFISSLLNDGIRLNLWENPYIAPEAKLYNPMLPYTGSHTVWLGIAPDYLLEEARHLIVEQHNQEHFSKGISGYKTDEVDGYDQWLWPDHAQFPSGTNGSTMRQIYGLSLQKTYQEGLFRKNNRRSYGQIRSSNGGASGYGNAIYSDAYGHKEFITGISAAGLCGILWCPEIRSAANAKEWLCRMQTTVCSPLAQLNAWADGTKPWSYSEVTNQIRELIELRMRLLPYLYTAFSEYNRKGLPPFRPMIMEAGYQMQEIMIKDQLDATHNPYATSRINEVTDQYMMGPSLMVAPFYEKQSDERKVILPPGNWYDFYTGKLAGNNTTIQVTNEGKIPLFAREGSIIPLLVRPVTNTDKAYGMPLELRYYGSAPAEYDLYEDDGRTFDYEKGIYRIRRIEVNTSSGTPEWSEKLIRKDGPALFGPVEKFLKMSVGKD